MGGRRQAVCVFHRLGLEKQYRQRNFNGSGTYRKLLHEIRSTFRDESSVFPPGGLNEVQGGFRKISTSGSVNFLSWCVAPPDIRHQRCRSSPHIYCLLGPSAV